MILRDGTLNVMQTVQVSLSYPSNKFVIVKTANTQAVSSISFGLLKFGTTAFAAAELADANFHLFKLGTPYSTTALTSANTDLLPVVGTATSRYVVNTTIHGTYADVTISLKHTGTIIGYSSAPTNDNSVGYVVYGISGTSVLDRINVTFKASVQLIQQG